MPHRRFPNLRYSLQTKWTLTVLGVGSLPLVLFALIAWAIHAIGLETAEREREAAILDSVSLGLQHVLDEAAEATYQVGQVLTEARIENSEVRLTLASEIVARAGALSAVAIYDSEGSLLDALTRPNHLGNHQGKAPDVGSTSTSLAAEIPPTLSKEAHSTLQPRWLQPSPSLAGAPSGILQVVEPVIRGGERRAFVLGIISTSAVQQQILRFSEQHFAEQTDSILLVDKNLRIIASADRTGVLRVGQSLVRRDIFHNINLSSDLSSISLTLVTQFRSYSGETMVGAIRALPDYQWVIAIRRPVDLAYNAMNHVQKLLLIFVTIFVLFTIFLGRWLARRTTRPIAQLVELTRAYARRQFAERSHVQTGDELEELGRALTKMADELASSEKELLRRVQVESGLSRFLPVGIAQEIAAGRRSLALGGERRHITVMFADVVAFTGFAESSSPEQTVAFLNELFTIMTEVIFRHGGTVDKFLGDCVMSIFGAPDDQMDHCQRALAAAEDIHRFVEVNAPVWKSKFGIDAKVAIGLSSGEALVGNLGSNQRMEYTAIGDTVNIAARLESLARPNQTLVTESVAAAAGKQFSFRDLGEHPLRGKRQNVRILEVV